MIVVGTIDRVVIQQRANTTNADQAEAASVVENCRSKQSEVRPPSTVNGQVRDLGLIDDRSEISRCSVDLGSLSRHAHGFCTAGHT